MVTLGYHLHREDRFQIPGYKISSEVEVPPGTPGYFTASMAGKWVGASNYGGPATAFAQFHGKNPVEPNRRMEIGTDDEDINRDVHLPKKLTHEGYHGEIYDVENDFYHHRQFMDVGAHLDGAAMLQEIGLCGVEIKTTNGNVMNQLKGNPLDDHYWQCIHQLYVVEDFKAIILYYKAGTDEELFIIRRDEVEHDIKFLADTIHHMRVNYIETNTLPDTQSAKDLDVIRATYPTAKDETITLDESINHAAWKYLETCEQIKRLQDIKAEQEAKIKSALGEAKAGASDHYKATWSRFTTKRFDSTAFKKDHPDLYESYKKELDSQRFSVSEIKKKEQSA
jgi:predicted phage-related endonuclease